jgi:hypothetical protein
MPELHTEVIRFKQWALNHENKSGEWECDYEYWGDLFQSAESVINRCKDGEIPEDLAEDLLYAIARDNECEYLREFLLDAPLLLSKLAKLVISSHESEAKW